MSAPILHVGCSVGGCDRKHLARGWCRLHYYRWRTNGSVDVVRCKVGENRSKHPLYMRYTGMKARCLNPNHKNYADYGGRGITICDRWLGIEGFTNFVNDMGSKPTPQHTIDRRDNDSGYSPVNCRWATQTEQVNNCRMRKDNTSGMTGVYWRKDTNKWRVLVTRNDKRVHLGYFIDKSEAINAKINYIGAAI